MECQGLESLPTVLAYEWRLQALFFHPIIRAINVTQPGGWVKISGRVDKVQHLAIIEVKDSGPNVPANVCDAFNRGDDLDLKEKVSLQTWVMLDMPGVRKLALIHGCQVSLESRKGDGTTCSICIPLGNATEA
jgi:signal transduction histidine kinase